MLRDAEYFKTRIGGLDGAAETADYFVNLVKSKPVPRPRSPTPPPSIEPPAQVVTNGAPEPAQESIPSTEHDTPEEKEMKGDKSEAATEEAA